MDAMVRGHGGSVNVLPVPKYGIVLTVAKAMGCDPSYVAFSALAVLVGAIGNSRRIRLKRGWTEPAIVWTALVGESGTLKSPPLDWITQPLRDREENLMALNAAALEEYQAELHRHAAAVAEWKNKKSSEPPPITPSQPILQRCLTSDADSLRIVATTTEGLLKLKPTTERNRERMKDFDFTCEAGIPTTQSY